jgi:hypothetical protein
MRAYNDSVVFMGNWDRSTPWRQGAFLTSEAAIALGLGSRATADHTAVIVVSHDCDLAQSPEHEEVVEVIVGRFLDQPAGNFMHCKNARRLHLSCSGGQRVCSIELDARSRIAIPKVSGTSSSLGDFSPDPAWAMNPSERRTLQRWLAARYDRAAFPDEFDRRLKEETGVADALAKAFKETGHYIPAVFFGIDEGQAVEHEGADDTYRLTITLLYLTDRDAEVAERSAEKAKARIEEIFRSRCTVKAAGVEWRWIELQGVEIMSDEAMTYAQSLNLTRWQADHVSLRAVPPQPVAQR